MSNIFTKLIEENEFPVVFIGSGISKRFVQEFPNWIGLLNEFWSELGNENFFGFANNIEEDIKKENPSLDRKSIDHYVNIKLGTIIEEEFNKAFNDGSIDIKDFTPEEAYRTKVSPFKKALSNRFSDFQLLVDQNNEELEAFKSMLLKTQIILTTNYDKFIEHSYNSISNYEINKYIGQNGFFKESFGFSELYKLHGCVDNPKEIIITEEDYDYFEENSVLISAKIISMMIHSPILFIGYSLSDLNVRNIIKDFTKSLNDEEIEFLENRLILIEREEGTMDFKEEVVNDSDLGCKIKVVKTDNFLEVFNQISKINQGIAPSEVRKYQHIIKELIIDRGKEGSLNSVLLSPEELNKLEGQLQNKNITVALGDSKYIFQIPDIITYSLDYISNNEEINTEIQLRFAIMQPARARFPMNKLLDAELIENSNLHPEEKDKLKQRIGDFDNFEKHYKKVIRSSVFNKDADNLQEIINANSKKDNIYETISYNIENLNLEEVKLFLIDELSALKEKGELRISTQLRRLMLLYDICEIQKG